MKLENVDLSKLRLADLPKFDKCPCELCDDGCFDRAGGEHFPECKRKVVQRTKLPLALRCPLTHYKATFQPITNIIGGPADHRRQPCPPPPDNEIPIAFKHAPMLGITSQKDHYPPPPPESLRRVSPVASVKQTDSILSPRAVPMETQSHYQVEYPEKPVLPISFRTLEIPSKESHIHLTEPTVPLSSETTTRSHFKSWQPTPSYPYAEMPAVVGHVLFPGTSRRFSTSTGSTFVPIKGVPAKPIARLENSSYPIRGSMDLQTSYRETFVPLKPVSARPTKQSVLTQESTIVRRPMNAVSQTSFDFRPYPKHRPPSPAELEPFVSQITICNSFAPSVTKSQYRSDFEGIDTKIHRREPPAEAKDKKQSYTLPYQKMDTLTVTQRDFPPLDVAALPRIRLVPMKATLSVNEPSGPMESVTMSRAHYQPYENIKSKRNYGEPIPEIYVPPTAKFEGTTTTGDTYKGQPGPRARSYMPEIKLINRTGEFDHKTNYRIDYHPHGLTLCAAKAYAIAQKKQKADVPISAQ